MTAQWYVRVRGKTLGPFSVAKLVQSRDQGQLQPSHEVSTDRQTWVPASTLVAVFPPGAAPALLPLPAGAPELLRGPPPAAVQRPAGRDPYSIAALATAAAVVVIFLGLSVLVLARQAETGKEEGEPGTVAAGPTGDGPAGEEPAIAPTPDKPTPEQPNKPTAVAARARTVLEMYCYRCHGKDGAAKGGFKDVLDHDRLVATGKVTPGNLAKSELYERVTSEDDPMPPAGAKPRPGPEDIAILKRWIEAGAADFVAAAPKAAFLTDENVLMLIAADLGRLPERDQRFTRYFTLTHLSNAGLPAESLETYRVGLSKLVNSLSWEREVVKPQPIDPARTIFRVDLRNYQWSTAVWTSILARNPFAIVSRSVTARTIVAATGCALPSVRGDWFVDAAARPPLYHEVLQLPLTAQALEDKLSVPVALNIEGGRVARAGFNGSGVSQNNRLIERHSTGYGAYWKSYDFGGNAGRRNLFENPLGPGTAAGMFQQDGGEIIFNLPNGLQAYMLVNGIGGRIDKGPLNIVSDPQQPDRAVENGISCMSCHVRGTIDNADQVRAHVEKSRRGFRPEEIEAIRALYPPREQFSALVKKDAERFTKAVQKTGASVNAAEPIIALAHRFEGEVTLPLAAAEVGLRPEEFLRELRRSSTLARSLGALQVSGGTVKRDVFLAEFPAIAAELKLDLLRN